MQVVTLADAKYSQWRFGVAEAVECKKGSVIDVPAWYAKALKRTGMAKGVGAPDPQPAEAKADDEVQTVLATDSARSLAEEHGVDLSFVEATGSGGKVIQRDVENYIAKRAQEANMMDNALAKGLKNRRIEDVSPEAAFGVGER